LYSYIGICQARCPSGEAPTARSCVGEMDETGMGTTAGTAIRRLEAVDDSQIEALASVLVDAIDSDAGVSFLHPLEPERAQEFWRGVADDVAAGRRALLVAEDDAGIVGTVQLVLAQPENQPHRADLSKMLVHRRGRRRGLGAALLEAAEETARDCGKTLLVLDTNTGSDAERLYARMGWIRVGEIPDFSVQPRGGLRATTVFYKKL
jgi:GNAT superfamily N-acetyltransferase